MHPCHGVHFPITPRPPCARSCHMTWWPSIAELPICNSTGVANGPRLMMAYITWLPLNASDLARHTPTPGPWSLVLRAVPIPISIPGACDQCLVLRPWSFASVMSHNALGWLVNFAAGRGWKPGAWLEPQWQALACSIEGTEFKGGKGKSIHIAVQDNRQTPHPLALALALTSTSNPKSPPTFHPPRMATRPDRRPWLMVVNGIPLGSDRLGLTWPACGK